VITIFGYKNCVLSNLDNHEIVSSVEWISGIRFG